MKQFISGLLLAATTIGAQAQTAMAAAGEKPSGTTNIPASTGAPAKNVVYLTPANQWSLIEMKVAGDMAYFNNIDGLSSLRVFITNGDGAAQMDMKINSQANGINIKRLKKGLYFLTLVNEATEDKKAFMLNRE